MKGDCLSSVTTGYRPANYEIDNKAESENKQNCLKANRE